MEPYFWNFFLFKETALFTYGVTNSGKTYTIIGTKNEPGILKQILHVSSIIQQHRYSAEINLSIKEVEEILNT